MTALAPSTMEEGPTSGDAERTRIDGIAVRALAGTEAGIVIMARHGCRDRPLGRTDDGRTLVRTRRVAAFERPRDLGSRPGPSIPGCRRFDPGIRPDASEERGPCGTRRPRPWRLLRETRGDQQR